MMAQYDLFSAAFKADPFPTYAELRQHAPIYAHRDRGGRTIWYITRYDDVVAVMRDPRFVKENPNVAAAAADSLQATINRNMLFSDPPTHTRLRALVNQAFTPRRVEQMRPAVQQAADALLAVAPIDRPFDLIAAYALPLSVTIISDMLGIPAADRDQVAEWSQSIIAPGGRGLPPRTRRALMRHLVAYIRALCADRQQTPRDDLVTALVRAEEAGDRLSEAELLSMIALLLVTGHETTVNLIGNSVLTLLTHPAQCAWLRAHLDALPDALEELLRYDGPVETSTTRWVGIDLTYHSHAMQRGDVVRVVITSANRDPAHFEQPDTLDLTRRPNRHLQFGHGIHYCLGAPLARLEGEIALGTLLRARLHLRLAQPAATLRWRSGVLFRGLETLPVVG